MWAMVTTTMHTNVVRAAKLNFGKQGLYHMNHTTISVLLPTRGRTEALDRSIHSLLDTAADASRVQILLAFDSDDEVGTTHFNQHLVNQLRARGVKFKAIQFNRLGYLNIHMYYNELAKHATGDWLFVWNDDAFMNTAGWDQVIDQYQSQMKVLKVHTHREHPYSIFPIVPRTWLDTLGHLSGHQMIDAWISQIAYMLDIIEIVDIDVTHDRHDLTGNNADNTYQGRSYLEGNPANPADFHNAAVHHRRMADGEKIAKVMQSQGQSTDWWDRVKTGAQDPWEKLKVNDVNGQMFQFKLTK